MSRSKNIPVPRNATFGFSFLIEANGGGTGTNPKTYGIDNPANQFLLGATSDNAPGVTLGWPSDPGDSPDPANRVAPLSRQYDAGVSPNNIRLSQVSLQSITASYGIRSEPSRPNLPTSFFWQRSLNGLPGAADDIVGDLSGIRRLVVTLNHPRQDALLEAVIGGLPQFGRILVNGSILLNETMPQVELEVSNLGLVTVVNLSTGFDGEGMIVPIRAVVGVHVEANL